MIKSIVAYVNYYFPSCKTQFYCDNFAKFCIVYKCLYAKYFWKNLDMDQIIYRLTEAKISCNSNSDTLSNRLIFSLAFRAFRKKYRIGRGCVYLAESPFQECEVLGYLTGIVYWCFHRGVV